MAILLQNWEHPEILLERTYIPIFFAGLTTKFRDYKAIDGGFTKPVPYKYENTKKLFINVLPELVYIGNPVPENCKIIDI